MDPILLIAGLLPVPMPNHPQTAWALCETASVEGIVLTGGTIWKAYGGSCPERDETEIRAARFRGAAAMPVLGFVAACK